MTIYDENMNIIENPDLTLGHLEPVQKVIHHDEIAPVEEQWHYEVATVYPNGGRDLQKVIDVPGRAWQAAYDEIVDYQLYIRYTQEELDIINSLNDDEEIEDDSASNPVEERLTALEEQNSMLMECVLEMSEILYA